MSFRNAMELSNNAFFQHKYALAYQYYESAISTAPSQKDRLIAESNLATLQNELGMEETSRNTSPIIQTSDSPPFNGFSDSDDFSDDQNSFKPGLKSLNELTENIENDKAHSNPFVQRGEIYTMMGQYKNATQDLEKSLTKEPTQLILYKLVNSALLSNDLDTYSYIINTFDEFDGFGALSQALLLWSTRRFDEALKYIQKAVEGQEEMSLLMRAKLYFVLGQINLSYNDWVQSGAATEDIIFVLKFLKDQLIPHEPEGDSWQCYVLKHFRAGVFKSLHQNQMSRVPLDLWIPLPVQNEWSTGGLKKYENSPLCQTEQTYPEGFAIGLSEEQIKASHLLLQTSLKIGISTSSRECSKRAYECVGMAVLEVREELLSSPLAISQAAAIACHWIRLFDPMQAIFLRYQLRDIITVIHIQRDLFLTDLIIFQPTVLSIVKEKIMDGVDDPIKSKIANCKTADDIWNVTRSDISIKCGTSDSEIYIRKMPPGNIEFGLCIPFNNEHWKEYSQAEVIWSGIMLALGKGKRIEALDLLMKFLYHWMRSSPLTAYSHTVGSILFHAILSAMTGRIAGNLPPPINIQMEALLSPDFPSFKASMVAHMKTPLIDMGINNLSSISKTLPNFLTRIAALQAEEKV